MTRPTIKTFLIVTGSLLVVTLTPCAILLAFYIGFSQ